ncbi:6-phosphofructo-2-kinase-domain-containing protein, partial [Ochromonadaceae sp. CCMP2298]
LALRSRSENAFLLFVESICDDQEVLTRNYDLKLQNEDYKGMTLEAARADFLERVHAYEKVYETIEDYEDSNQICYIKLINVGQKVITRNCHGYLPSQVAFYLQNVHIHPRKIYLSITSEGVRELQKGGGMLGGLGSVGSVGSMASVGSAGSGLEGMGRGLGNKSPSSDRLTGREGKLTPAGASYSSALADYIRYEQQTDLVEAGKEIMVLT